MFIAYTLLAFLEIQKSGVACVSVSVLSGIGLLALAMFGTYRQERGQNESENGTGRDTTP